MILAGSGFDVVHQTRSSARCIQISPLVSAMIVMRLNQRDATGLVGLSPLAVLVFAMQFSMKPSLSPASQNFCETGSFIVATVESFRQTGHS